MDYSFVRNRITELRIKKGVSEYRMSRDLGHSNSYVQSISSGKALPSFAEFFYICEYISITHKEFFETDISEHKLLNRLNEFANTLDEADLKVLSDVAERLSMKTTHSQPTEKGICV